ncbi:MAG: DUF4293 domain-containing protein [Bacteroidota bacterium]
MIQRIQSIFLLIVALALLTATTVPIWSQAGIFHLSAWQLQEINITGELMHRMPYSLLGVCCWLAAIVALYELFRYDNRGLQLRLGTFNNLLVLIMLFSILYLTRQKAGLSLVNAPGKYHLGFFLLIIALAGNLLANHFIRKDEKLVRSADRMR